MDPQVAIRRAWSLVVLSAIIPGAAQRLVGDARIGRWAMRVWAAGLVSVLVVAILAVIARGPLIAFLLTPGVASLIRVILWSGFAGWLFLLFDAWRLAKPPALPQRVRLGLTASVLSLMLLGGGITAYAARGTTAVDNVAEVFAGGGDVEASAGRYNVLLLGVDAAAHRDGLRPDSITVASIDKETGNTVLIGMPRNLQHARFSEDSPLRNLYPDGYVCDDGTCMLNGVYLLGQQHASLYPKQVDPGLEAMKDAAEGTLGLKINYYAMVDMSGFVELIDAMGGITVNSYKPIPIGGVGSPISGYIEPGEPIHLDGYHALWYARSRAESDDYERMTRQKCVMSAMVKQLDPATVATRFVELSEAGANIVLTDVGPGQVGELIDLALLAKGQGMKTLNLTPPLISTANPDFDVIHSAVAAAIAPPPAASSPESVPASAAASPTETSAAHEASTETETSAAAEPSPTAEPAQSSSEDPSVVCSVG